MMYLQVAAGLVILLVCGELLVRGSVALAEQMGVSKLVIGFTVIAFGTSAPELVVCIQAAIDGVPGIAFGNVIGSNIANILLVIGIPALIYPLVCDTRSALRDSLIMVAASILFMVLAWNGTIELWQGVLLVAFLAAVVLRSYFRARKEGDESADEALEEYEQNMPKSLWISLIFILMGLIGLVLGSHLLVKGAELIAQAAGVSDEIIGLTLVALGTSLPELATSIIAAFRRHGDVAIGNVLGSNLFNITGIIGATAIVEPMAAPEQILHFDLWIMLFVSLLMIPIFIARKPIGRVLGGAFCIAYVAYVTAQFYGMSGVYAAPIH
ncbi:calcium/sodium antiporter [Sneathiella chungangensis]|uniref:Calcium/sodium antiporter n=1 Tax=Sneathiella chungangensis TaxID=1418234 RepID=A0A845MHZ9_9PROT|nr:calcium/sodium antiporter [Sneathiella chungangensis]MZR22624.1 calcium/sodium antiporter [Sneathiella chungangensis]